MRHVQRLSLAALLTTVLLAAPARAAVVEPHGTVGGKSLQQWSAEWWQKVFALPVYAPDGTTVTHPQFDSGLQPTDTLDATYSRPSDDGQVTFLFGSFFGGTLTRSATVPANKPIFVPLVNDEWSNPDTAAKPDFTTLPGNHTQAELQAFATAQTDTITGLFASLDGADVPNLTAHREPSPAFSYTVPAQHSILSAFFGNTEAGPFESAADGYYLMLEPLAPGQHTLHFGGSSPDNTATPPLLGAFTLDMTYNITVQGGGTAIPLPAGIWLGLTVLPLAIRAVKKRGA